MSYLQCGSFPFVIFMKYGYWTVVPERTKLSKKTCVECICGQVRFVAIGDLRRGKTKSCGCKKGEMLTATKIIHGHSKRTSTSPIYTAWQNMRTRATNPNRFYAKDYVLRGITCCDRWAQFQNFNQDMGPTHFQGATLERIDVNGNYCPDNCRWATLLEQGQNKRNTRFITLDGETKTIRQWATILNIPYLKLYNQYCRKRP